MDKHQRQERLAAAIEGSGAKVNDPYGIDVFESAFSDEHVARFAGWADLEFLIANCTRLTDRSLDGLCSFERLTDLGIGGTAITSAGLERVQLPLTLTHLALFEIPLTDDAVHRVACCRGLQSISATNCQLSWQALLELASLPELLTINAVSTDTTPESSGKLSAEFPHLTLVLNDGVWRGGVCRRKRSAS